LKFIGRSIWSQLGADNQTVVSLKFGNLIEVTPAGVIVSTFQLGVAKPYITFEPVGPNGDQVAAFTFLGILPFQNKQVVVKILFSQWNVDTTINSIPTSATTLAPELITIPAGAVKLRVWIANWPFSSPNNKLRLEMKLRLGEDLANPGSTEVSFVTIEELIYLFTSLLLGVELKLTYLDTCVVDAGLPTESKQPISFSQQQGQYLVNVFDLTFEFPYFNETCHYDPSLEVTLGASSNSNSGNNLGLILGITAGGLICIALVIVTVIILVGVTVVILLKRRTIKRLQKVQSRFQTQEQQLEVLNQPAELELSDQESDLSI
jgi:hypothetical protein